MGDNSDVSKHYTSGDLLDRLMAVLAADGLGPDHLSVENLSPYDQFHARGVEATKEMVDDIAVTAADHLLDVGSGIGGPSRYIADRFGCRVTGIDLTAEFCDVARHLTRQLGLADRVVYEQGNALAMPFDDASFDGAYSMNVSMNIADKAGFYREIYRVLRPGAWLVLSEIAQGPNDDLVFPTPWAQTAETSFLETPSATAAGLEACGFKVLNSRDTVQEALAFGARSRVMVERGEKPPHRSVQLIHGEGAPVLMANIARGVAKACILPIEIYCRKPS